MVTRRVLVAIPSPEQQAELTEMMVVNAPLSQVTSVGTSQRLWEQFNASTFYRCVISAELLSETCIARLKAHGHLNRTVIVGRVGPEQAIRFVRQGALDYIESDNCTPARLQLALERPIPINLQSDPAANLMRLVENAHSIHALLDPQGNITYLNPIGVETLGYLRSLDEFCHHVCGPIDHQAVQDRLRHARLFGFWQTEVQYRANVDAEERTLIVRLIPLRHAEDEMLVGYGLLAHDMTEMRAADKRARESTARMLQVAKQKEAFISTISHEFRTPLATILSSADLLHQYGASLSAEKRLMRLQRIKLQVRRMVRLLDEVLLLSRLENVEANWVEESFNMKSLVVEVVQDVREQYRDSHSYQVDGVISAEFYGKRALIRQAVANLLSNATKYSPEGSHVRINLHATEATITLTVQDQGIGIPAQDHDQLFNKFFRASNIGTRSGTGLGLAITKRAVEIHGGTITFTSQTGMGTTFTIMLPTLHPTNNSS